MGQHIKTSPDSKAVIQSDESATGRRKRLLLAAGALLLLAIAGSLIWLLSYDIAKPKPLAPEKIDQAVQGFDTNADFAAAEKALEKQLAAEKDPKKKADIYVRLSSIALQQKQYAKAVGYQIDAGNMDAARKDSLAASIGDAYVQMGEKQKALPYYKQALAYYESRPDTFSGRQYLIQTTRAKIEEMTQ